MPLHVRVYFYLYTRNSCTFTMIHKPLCIWYGFDNVAICLLQVIRYSQSAAFYVPTISVVYWKRIVKQYPEYEQKSQRRRHASSISNCGYILKRSVQWNMRTTFYSTFVRSVRMSFCCKCSGIHINICIHTCMMLTIARTFMHVRFISNRIYLVLEHLNPWLRFLYRAQCHILPFGLLAFSIKLHFPADASLHGHSTVYTIYSTYSQTHSRVRIHCQRPHTHLCNQQ